MFDTRRATPVSSRFPGNGKPVYSGYQTVTVTLTSQVAVQKGTVAITAAAADFAPCDHILLDFVIKDKKTPSNMTKCPCDFTGTLDIHLPTPLPADLATYVAESFKKHSLVASNMLVANTAGVVKYTMLNPGYEFIVTPRANEKGKLVTAVPTITQAATNGAVPTIGGGAAVWYHESVKSRSPMRSRVGSVGWVNAPTGAAPRFAGILRSEDVLFNNECDCFFVKDTCDTMFHHGFVQIPLEVPFTTMPTDPVLYGRHTSDAAVQGGKVGGYRILAGNAPAPAGMAKLSSHIQIVDVQGSVAIVEL